MHTSNIGLTSLYKKTSLDIGKLKSFSKSNLLLT